MGQKQINCCVKTVSLDEGEISKNTKEENYEHFDNVKGTQENLIPETNECYSTNPTTQKREQNLENDLQQITVIIPEETKENTERIRQIIVNISNLNSRDERIANAFNGDRKYARSFKKVIYDTTGKEPESIKDHHGVYMVMRDSKDSVDNEVAKNSAVLENEPYVKKAISKILIQSGKNNQEKMSLAQIKAISNLLTHEYHEEYEGIK